MQLAHQAGIPEGVFNVVTTSSECTPDVVKTLCTHPTVRKISFTGSTAVGKVSCCMHLYKLWSSCTLSVIRAVIEINYRAVVCTLHTCVHACVHTCDVHACDVWFYHS